MLWCLDLGILVRIFGDIYLQYGLGVAYSFVCVYAGAHVFVVVGGGGGGREDVRKCKTLMETL